MNGKNRKAARCALFIILFLIALPVFGYAVETMMGIFK